MQGSKGSSEFRCGESLCRAFPSRPDRVPLLVQPTLAREHARNLAGAVGAEVEVDAHILVANLPDGLPAASTMTKGIRNSSVMPLL